MRVFGRFSNRLAGAAVAAWFALSPANALNDEDRLRLLQAEGVRVETIFLRLTRAAPASCPRKAPQLGLMLHQRAQYLPETRIAAARLFGLSEAPGILAVASDGPAARAGLMAGDSIVAVNGTALPAPPPDATQGNAGRLAEEALDGEAARGPVTLMVRRGGLTLAVVLAAEQGCAGAITLDPSTALTATAGQNRIVVTTALVEFARTDDELAFLIAHELAHLAASENRGREAEAAADRAGLRFARAAGYDPCQAPVVLERLARTRGQRWRIDLEHPAMAQRLAALRAMTDGTCSSASG